MQGDENAIVTIHPAPAPFVDCNPAEDLAEEYFLRTGKVMKPFELTKYQPPSRKKSKPLFPNETRRTPGFQ